MADIQIRPFQPGDQSDARDLILAGLGDHFDVLDPTLNPDLESIAEIYIAQGDFFLVAVEGTELVGTGALIRESEVEGRIVRMSVAADRRRRGIARLMVGALIEIGQEAGYREILVETNDDWHGAIRLYEQCGFQPIDHRNGEIHMQLNLVADDQ